MAVNTENKENANKSNQDANDMKATRVSRRTPSSKGRVGRSVEKSSLRKKRKASDEVVNKPSATPVMCGPCCKYVVNYVECRVCRIVGHPGCIKGGICKKCKKKTSKCCDLEERCQSKGRACTDIMSCLQCRKKVHRTCMWICDITMPKGKHRMEGCLDCPMKPLQE